MAQSQALASISSTKKGLLFIRAQSSCVVEPIIITALLKRVVLKVHGLGLSLKRNGKRAF